MVYFAPKHWLHEPRTIRWQRSWTIARICSLRGGWSNDFVCPAALAVAIEFRAAVATFMVMAYIIFANSSILGTLADSRGESPALPAVLTVTCLSAGCLCILMGLFADVPFALAPGMGLNAVIAFQLVGQMRLAVPLSLKQAIAAGIGIFIALIGFVNSGLVVQGKGTVVAMGTPSGLRILVFMISFLVTGWLLIRRVPGALVMGILLASVAAVTLNLVFGRGRAFGTAAVLPTHGFGLGYGLGARGPSSDVLISGVSRPWDFQQRRW